MKTCSIDGCERKRDARGWCSTHYKRWQKHGDPEYVRPAKSCNVGDCDGPVRGYGMCNMHYLRWRRNGDPLDPGNRVIHPTPEECFLARSEPIVGDPGCIIWTGSVASGGYGSLRVNGRTVPAHRYAWEQQHGPIPDGMFIDHMCWERSCVNTEHLRLATHAENTWNRSGPQPGRKHDLPRGVSRNGKGYMANVQRGGVQHYCGTFPTIAEASAAASNKRDILFGEYAGRA